MQHSFLLHAENGTSYNGPQVLVHYLVRVAIAVTYFWWFLRDVFKRYRTEIWLFRARVAAGTGTDPLHFHTNSIDWLPIARFCLRVPFQPASRARAFPRWLPIPGRSFDRLFSALAASLSLYCEIDWRWLWWVLSSVWNMVRKDPGKQKREK